MRSFKSDNNAGLCPEALDAMQVCSSGHDLAYGDDACTADAIEVFREIFGAETSVWFVATGTAGNTLAIAALTASWQQVLCHQHSHYNVDESTAPERLTGCRTVAIEAASGKLSPADIERIAERTHGDVHRPQAGVVTISNPTEFGLVYTPEEVRAICDVAHERGYRVHVDGARFANAVAALGCDPLELSVEAGVDALTFGGTKNGLAWGEAVLLLPQGDGRAFERAVDAFPYIRKSAGHLLSKQRFVSAPFAATLRDEIWLNHARHANEMAASLSSGLAEAGLSLRYPTESNGVFVTFSDALTAALLERGHDFYPKFGDPAWGMARLLCSFDTEPTDVREFIADAAGAVTA